MARPRSLCFPCPCASLCRGHAVVVPSYSVVHQHRVVGKKAFASSKIFSLDDPLDKPTPSLSIFQVAITLVSCTVIYVIH